MADQISNQIKTTRVSNAVAAGTSDIDSSSVDMTDFEGVRFTVAFGTITSGAATTIKAAQSANDSSWNDLLATAITVADDDDNQLAVLDIWRPKDRYVRCTVTRATQNAVVDGIVAEQYGPRLLPTTDDSSTVVAREIHSSPAEGTA